MADFRLLDRQVVEAMLKLKEGGLFLRGLVPWMGYPGLWYCRGDAAITMDADLQHPPSLIPDMVRLWRQGFDVVYAKKRHHNMHGLRHLQVRPFYLGSLKALGA